MAATKNKAAKASKAAKAAKKENGVEKAKDQRRIKVIGENPHRADTVADTQFKTYKGNPTVATALERGLLRPYLYMHKKMGLVEVE